MTEDLGHLLPEPLSEPTREEQDTDGLTVDEVNVLAWKARGVSEDGIDYKMGQPGLVARLRHGSAAFRALYRAQGATLTLARQLMTQRFALSGPTLADRAMEMAEASDNPDVVFKGLDRATKALGIGEAAKASPPVVQQVNILSYIHTLHMGADQE